MAAGFLDVASVGGPLPVTVTERYPHGYAVVDVETSGLNAESHRVLQVAVTQLNARGG